MLNYANWLYYKWIIGVSWTFNVYVLKIIHFIAECTTYVEEMFISISILKGWSVKEIVSCSHFDILLSHCHTLDRNTITEVMAQFEILGLHVHEISISNLVGNRV